MLLRSYDSFQLNTIRLIESLIIFFIGDGPNKTNSQEVNRTEGAPQAASSPKDRPEVRPYRFRSQETSPFQTWNSCFEIDQKIPKKRKSNLITQSSWLSFISLLLSYSD